MLKVFSIFDSISGEIGSVPQGTLTKFLRLSGCNLHCPYCDAKDAHTNGKKMSSQQIINKLQQPPQPEHLLITGGEPLLQLHGLDDLLPKLQGIFTHISLETNGTIFIAPKDSIWWSYFTSVIFDIKMPSAIHGSVKPMTAVQYATLVRGLRQQGINPYIKAVIQSEQDFHYAREWFIEFKKLVGTYTVGLAMSPCQPDMPPATLYNLMIDYDLMDIILNIQIHKYIWQKEIADILTK